MESLDRFPRGQLPCAPEIGRGGGEIRAFPHRIEAFPLAAVTGGPAFLGRRPEWGEIEAK